jgi:hypothetical protein
VTGLFAVTWSPEQAEFVAVGAGGVASSPDGVTWSAVTEPGTGTQWNSIVWSPAVAKYVSVAFDGTGDRVLVGTVPPPATPPTAPSASAPTASAAPAAAPAPELPPTGVDATPALLLGGSLLALGAIAVAVAVRHRQRDVA